MLGIKGDQAVWKLQFGRPGQKAIDEVSAADLLKFVSNPWFVVTPDNWVQMVVDVAAVTTSGSTYPRCELREMTLGGAQAAWDTTKDRHYIDYDFRPDAFPPGKGEIVGGQIHDDQNDLVEVLFTPGKVTWRIDGTSKGQKVLDYPATGARCRLEVAAGTVNFYVNDFATPVLTSKIKATTKAYFKVGNYLQSNTTKDKAGALGKASLRNVRLFHTTVSTPPPPPPVDNPPPATAQPIIMIIRHGEKPSDKNDHTLSPQGQQRAHALPPIFTGPKAGLFKPTWIFASKGASSSMRMVQTAQPTADALGLTLDTRYDVETAVSDTAKLLVSQAKAGEIVLAVLEHSALPAVCKALGTSAPKAPTTWPDDRFDMVFVFVGDGKGGWNFTQVPELVLPTDKSTPIK